MLIPYIIIIFSTNFVSGVYDDCKKEVDADKSLTYAEKIIQKRNCDTYGNRNAEVTKLEPFGISIRASDAHHISDNTVDLGTIVHIDGKGAYNADVIITLEKIGSKAISATTNHGASSGAFGTQFYFYALDDIGDYILTAKNVKTGEEDTVKFSVKQLGNPESDPVPSIQEQTNTRINELEQRIEKLETQIKQKDAVIMEQLKVIMELASKIKKVLFDPFIVYLPQFRLENIY